MKKRVADRLRERKVSYVSWCLCPLVSAGLDYPEFSTDLQTVGHTGASQEKRGGLTWACAHAIYSSFIFINDFIHSAVSLGS